MVEIRNPTVEILEQGESDNKDILEEEVIKTPKLLDSSEFNYYTDHFFRQRNVSSFIFLSILKLLFDGSSGGHSKAELG